MMFSIFLATVFLLAFLWISIKWKKVKDYWAVRNVAHLPPHPLLGSLTFLMKQNPAVWMRQLKEQLPSPFVGIWLFWKPGLVINCPDIARRVLVTDSDFFRDRTVGLGNSDPVGSLNLFTVKDPIWTTIRRRLTVVFTSAKLKTFQNLMLDKSNELVQRIRNDINENLIIDLRSLFSDYTTDVISVAAFGVNSNATLTSSSPMRSVTREFMRFSVVRSIEWCFIFFFPKIADIFRFQFFPKQITDYFRNIFSNVVAQRGGYNRKVDQVKDLVDALLKMKQDASTEDGLDMNEDLLVAQAAVFLQGGFDTTAVTLTYAMYELAFAPELQEKLYDELSKAKFEHGGIDFDANTLSGLPYLNSVIKETLRKYPAMGWLDRIASRDYEMAKDLTIPAGTTVYINAYAMHYDADLFPKPDEFDPDRFLPENEGQIKPFSYLPFGDGPRHCIGMRFALQSLRFVLSSIILNFKLKPVPESPLPTKCGISNRSMFLAPEIPLSVEFWPR